jgi:hypothetical protein
MIATFMMHGWAVAHDYSFEDPDFYNAGPEPGVRLFIYTLENREDRKDDRD